MPLEPYPRGAVWWARGRVEYNGAPITEYYRCSTGASEEQGAWDWCRKEEQSAIRIHLLGEDPEEKTITFADAVLKYDAKPKEAAYLVPITLEIGAIPIQEISPKLVRELGPKLYPNCSTDTWTRQVVTPVRAVLNNINDSESGIAFRVRGYTQKEKVAQDNKRKSTGRKKYPPGSWEWLLKFREHAPPRLGALALLMFVTGARISQAVSMHPHKHINKAKGMICIPGAKGHEDRWLRVPDEILAELTALPEVYPRKWKRKPENLRLFGYADRGGPRNLWNKACEAAGIEQIPFHPAGRHGFGQEMNVRERVDEKAAGAFGGWSDLNLMRNTYTHAEDAEIKINQALRRGLLKAERKTRLKLRKEL